MLCVFCLLYGVEIWTKQTTILNKLEAFEMWFLLKVPWINKVTNEEILWRVGKRKGIVNDDKNKENYLLRSH